MNGSEYCRKGGVVKNKMAKLAAKRAIAFNQDVKIESTSVSSLVPALSATTFVTSSLRNGVPTAFTEPCTSTLSNSSARKTPDVKIEAEVADSTSEDLPATFGEASTRFNSSIRHAALSSGVCDIVVKVEPEMSVTKHEAQNERISRKGFRRFSPPNLEITQIPMPKSELTTTQSNLDIIGTLPNLKLITLPLASTREQASAFTRDQFLDSFVASKRHQVSNERRPSILRNKRHRVPENWPAVHVELDEELQEENQRLREENRQLGGFVERLREQLHAAEERQVAMANIIAELREKVPKPQRKQPVRSHRPIDQLNRSAFHTRVKEAARAIIGTSRTPPAPEVVQNFLKKLQKHLAVLADAAQSSEKTQQSSTRTPSPEQLTPQSFKQADNLQLVSADTITESESNDFDERRSIDMEDSGLPFF